MMGSARAIASILVVWLAAAQPAPQQPVFRAGTDYVQLDVVVTDQNDRAIRDLTQADFEIAERGRPQTVADVQFIDVPPVHRTVTDVRTTAPTVDVVTNTHQPTGRQWVLVIDDLHIIELHLRQTKQVVQEFLESVPAEDQVAIVFVGRSDLSQGFTSDLGAQMRTVGRIKDSLGLAYDAADVGGATIPGAASEATPNKPAPTPIASSADIAVSSRQDPAERDRYQYALSTVNVLKNISASLVQSTYPRKALVYVSEGITYSIDNAFHSGYLDFSVAVAHAKEVQDEMTRTFEAARRGGIPVYTIDPRGLPDCSAVRGDCGFQPFPWDNIRAQMNNMRTLAENTGGRAFVGGSDLSRSVRELVEDNSSFYVIGYYPQPFERDGKFHDVKVTVKRPGARVRARAGYEAPRAGAATSAADTRKSLDVALAAALPSSSLALRAFAAPVAPGPRGMKTAVTLEVTYPAPPDGSKIADDLQFGMMAIDHDGKVKASAFRAFRFTGSPGGAAEVTYAINDVIELPSQPVELRVAVASQSLGKTGAIYLPVEPIDPSRDEIQAGSVVLGLDGPAREAAVPPGAFDGLVPFQPTTARTFAATDTLRVFVPLFWASKDASATVMLSIRRGEEAVVTRRGQAAAAPGGTHRQASFTDTLPLADLETGSYVLHVEAAVTGGHASTRDIAFEIR